MRRAGAPFAGARHRQLSSIPFWPAETTQCRWAGEAPSAGLGSWVLVGGNCGLDCFTGRYAYAGQYAPRPRTTAEKVFHKIIKSSASDQFST